MAVKRGIKTQRCYVYALTNPGLPARFTVLGRALHAREVRNVTAILEHRSETGPADEQSLREQHAIVLELALRAEALLPMRFGALFEADELDARIESEQDVILRALDRVRGRVQMTVRVHVPRRPARAVAASPPASGTAYLRARGEKEKTVRLNAARVRRGLMRLVVDERVEAGRGEVETTVYHLIDAADVASYRAALEESAGALAPRRVTVTGPWPAFAFVPELGR